MVVDALVGGSVGFVVVVVVEVMISCGLTVFALGFSLLLSSVSLLLNFTVLFESVETPIEYFLSTEIPKSFFNPVNCGKTNLKWARGEVIFSSSVKLDNVEHKKRNSIFLSSHVLFCLLCKHLTNRSKSTLFSWR